jgi:hypothetical protein
MAVRIYEQISFLYQFDEYITSSFFSHRRGRAIDLQLTAQPLLDLVAGRDTTLVIGTHVPG